MYYGEQQFGDVVDDFVVDEGYCWCVDQIDLYVVILLCYLDVEIRVEIVCGVWIV